MICSFVQVVSEQAQAIYPFRQGVEQHQQPDLFDQRLLFTDDFSRLPVPCLPSYLSILALRSSSV